MKSKITQIVYVASPESQQIYVWKLDEFKELLELMQIVSTCGQAQPMAINPTQRFLYVGIRPNFSIYTYCINREGLLNKIKIVNIASSPTHITMNAQSTFLYYASYNYNAISVIALDDSGMPNDNNSIVQTIENLLGCHSVNIDRTERLLWVPCLKENVVRLFNINKHNGKLIPYHLNYIKTKIDSGPRHMIFHRSADYAYVINEFNGTINVLSYNIKEKYLCIIQTINILPITYGVNINKLWAADIHITPDSRWVYCSDRLTNTISYFEILSDTKKLRFIGYKHTEKQPRGFAIDKTGNFLIVAGQKSHCISLYRINLKNGKLNFLSRYQSGKGPMWINIVFI
ncbi:6-phosphogluconolactonase [Candidatus Blochmanniella vafra str. BVAF]|uniref:6-phosphogluconolactonase n=1 Tax=Blochmanniella vafra (strain BVAF) TaxID=859654 RepID=E8Q6Z0_BLOVB|nr:6-phosphogluconolactonase [Candidatus Blochmannia vafer]ADV33737.1 6-phosphogluconolactonase [Candidatus Blochmannia vafer str. BVAF]